MSGCQIRKVDMTRMMKSRQKAKKLYLLALVILLLAGTGSIGVFVAYQTYSADYRADMSLAQKGAQHLRTAASLLATFPSHPLETNIVSHAQNEFNSATSTFSTLDTNLKALPGIITLIPVYGSRLRAALSLASAATDISQAGSAGCALLDKLLSKFHDPLNSVGHGLSMADNTSIDQVFQQVKTALSQTIDEAGQLQPGDLQFDPHMNSMLTSFQKEIPALQAWLEIGEKLIPVLPTLLGIGTPAHYLIEVLDSSELRPTGGFIGNYGIATFTGGYLTDTQIRDVVLLDYPFENSGHRIPYPSNYTWFSKYLSPNTWRFRDSNLDADFPTAAREGELEYTREGGNVPVQGVIAITPVLIQHMLEMTGPINVPEYNETVTSQNLIALIHYHQLGGETAGEGSSYIPSPDGLSSMRKHFLALLAEQLQAHVRKFSPTVLPEFFQLLLNSLNTKDIQFYFNASSAENLLQDLHLDGTIQAPPGDSLFIVDTNVSPNKANSFILNTVNDKVTIDAEGNAIHRATITYAWTLPGINYGNALYRDYLRIYVPSGSTLQFQSGWQPLGTSEAFKRSVWTGFFTLTFGQTRTISLQWTVPGAAQKDAQGWHYQDLIQRQAGMQRTLHVETILPPCASVTNKWGGIAIDSKHALLLNQSLAVDMNLGMDYNC